MNSQGEGMSLEITGSRICQPSATFPAPRDTSPTWETLT